MSAQDEGDTIPVELEVGGLKPITLYIPRDAASASVKIVDGALHFRVFKNAEGTPVWFGDQLIPINFGK